MFNKNTKTMKTRYNKSEVMKRAWKIYRSNNGQLTWSESLIQSWNVEKNGTNNVDFNFIYNKYYSQVLNYVRSKVNGKTEIAEEITQDTFIKANEHLANYDVYKAKVTTWLYTIANRKVIDYYRTNVNKTKRMVSVDGYTDENGKETYQFVSDSYNVETVEGNEVNEAIERAMNTLNDKEKAIAEFYFLYEKQYNEIAELLDIPIGSVKGTINRIRGKLQSKLKKTYEAM